MPDDAQLPDDPEFRAAFVGYVEWGTRIALHNSKPGADVAEHANCAAMRLGSRAAVHALRRHTKCALPGFTAELAPM